jgi:hypothetical protein
MTVKPVTEAAYRRNEICSSGLVLIRDMGSPNHQSGGTPGVGSLLGRFGPLVSMKILWLQHAPYRGAVMGTQAT